MFTVLREQARFLEDLVKKGSFEVTRLAWKAAKEDRCAARKAGMLADRTSLTAYLDSAPAFLITKENHQAISCQFSEGR
ncbi:hypothetical protein [Xanthomonas hortorum]|nr:hypothetical protein [Xanthomonas hortorum]MDT7824228.1 hypothetical protein [Xanthomonas hortorum pv. vitians]NMI30495.1 hypothetical protein [Xanthomonas hortorum pv. vitians]